MTDWKEVSKFLSGLTAWESLVHASLWLSRTTPAIFGITLTENLNIVQTIIPAIASALLAYYAWIRR